MQILRRGRGTLAASVAVSNFTFACAHTALGEPVGVAGFGRGLLLLPWRTGTLARPRTSVSSSPSSPRVTAASTTPWIGACKRVKKEMQRSVGDGAMRRKGKTL